MQSHRHTEYTRGLGANRKQNSRKIVDVDYTNESIKPSRAKASGTPSRTAELAAVFMTAELVDAIVGAAL